MLYSLSEISIEEKEQIYDLYKSSYTNAGADVWFCNQDELCSNYEYVFWLKSKDKIVCGFLFRKFNLANKISIIFHNGEQVWKKLLMNMIATFLKSPGWMIECTGKVSHILKNKFSLQPITDISKIKLMLDVSTKNYEIEMIREEGYTYVRTVKDSNGRVFHNKENLFGCVNNFNRHLLLIGGGGDI